MSPALLRAVQQYLTALEHVQQDLLASLEAADGVFIRAQAAETQQWVEREGSQAARLQGLQTLRERLLAQCRSEGLPATSLAEAAQFAPEELRADLAARIAASRELSARLQHASWARWITAHRAQQHYSEIVDLIAQGGRPAATYGDPAAAPGRGGAVLDASC